MQIAKLLQEEKVLNPTADLVGFIPVEELLKQETA